MTIDDTDTGPCEGAGKCAFGSWLAPQKDRTVNHRAAPGVGAPRAVKDAFDGGRSDGVRVPSADLVVLGGRVTAEAAARDETVVPFTPGRVHVTQALTDIDMFTWLEPVVDASRDDVKGHRRHGPMAA